METEESQLELYASIRNYREKRSHVLHEVAVAGLAVRDAVFKEGALSVRVKRLMAMAVALSVGCVPCIIGQTKYAVEAGATREEILEAVSVLQFIQGATGISESWRVIKVLEELGMM